MTDRWEYHVTGYYGPGGRAGNNRNPNRGRPGERQGDAALTVGCNGSRMEAEVAAFKSRGDIGEIVVVGPTVSATIYRRTEEGWTQT